MEVGKSIVEEKTFAKLVSDRSDLLNLINFDILDLIKSDLLNLAKFAMVNRFLILLLILLLASSPVLSNIS